MKIRKQDIAWATMTTHENGEISYCTNDCAGVEIWVTQVLGHQCYRLTFETANDNSPFNSIATRLTPQAWAAIREDVAKYT